VQPNLTNIRNSYKRHIQPKKLVKGQTSLTAVAVSPTMRQSDAWSGMQQSVINEVGDQWCKRLRSCV